MRRTPTPAARRITSALRVSMESGTRKRGASTSSTGITRRNSSSRSTGSAPGLVDSAPMSMMSAPSASSRSACATARRGARKRPPSEKLSGVTLTMPMIRGRSNASPAMGARGLIKRSINSSGAAPPASNSAAVNMRRPILSPSRSISSAAQNARSRGPPLRVWAARCPCPPRPLARCAPSAERRCCDPPPLPRHPDPAWGRRHHSKVRRCRSPQVRPWS